MAIVTIQVATPAAEADYALHISFDIPDSGAEAAMALLLAVAAEVLEKARTPRS